MVTVMSRMRAKLQRWQLERVRPKKRKPVDSAAHPGPLSVVQLLTVTSRLDTSTVTATRRNPRRWTRLEFESPA